MWRVRQALSLVRYLARARVPGQLHSPYLFALLRQIHDPDRWYYVFDAIENRRIMLLKNMDLVDGQDFGAGSKISRARTVSHIARTSASGPGKCQMIFRLIACEKPADILELGTSLGIMTAYLASAFSETKVETIEGNPELSALAKSTAEYLDTRNITFHTGRFSDVLPDLLKENRKYDFVLIDGDHRGEALRKYFSMINPYLSKDAIVMIDDIRWSADMYAAWRDISRSSAVRCSLDYFSFGLLFFRSDFLDKITLQILPKRFPPTILY